MVYKYRYFCNTCELEYTTGYQGSEPTQCPETHEDIVNITIAESIEDKFLLCSPNGHRWEIGIADNGDFTKTDLDA